jgi:hypothetical protein
VPFLHFLVLGLLRLLLLLDLVPSLHFPRPPAVPALPRPRPRPSASPALIDHRRPPPRPPPLLLS